MSRWVYVVWLPGETWINIYSHYWRNYPYITLRQLNCVLIICPREGTLWIWCLRCFAFLAVTSSLRRECCSSEEITTQVFIFYQNLLVFDRRSVVFDLATHFYELGTIIIRLLRFKQRDSKPHQSHQIMSSQREAHISFRTRAVCHSSPFLCSDVNECLQSDSPCGPNSVCTNILGRAKCSCLRGFSSSTGKDWILGSLDNFLCAGNILRLSATGLWWSTHST